MTFLELLDVQHAHGYRVEQIALRRVIFISANGFSRARFMLVDGGFWEWYI